MNDNYLTRWSTPNHYVGFNPIGDYLLYGRNRDSNILTNSNFEVMAERLLKKASQLPPAPPEQDAYGHEYPDGWVYTFTASCWAQGWREYLLLRTVENPPDGYQELVEYANEMFGSLMNDYPVLDDDVYSERQDEALMGYWNGLSMSERVQLCQEHGHSIFSARRNYPPERVWDDWYESGDFC